MNPSLNEGLLLLNKPLGKSSFYLVHLLRKITGIRKIGHAGTLDPFATGLMVMLVGKSATTKQDLFLNGDKEYRVIIKLGEATDTFDNTGSVTEASSLEPTLNAIEEALKEFQGTISQIPPMFSAKKVNGQKLYDLARKGISIERKPEAVTLSTTLISYNYPYLELLIQCSKGTYIRSIAHDLGLKLGCYAHADALARTKSGSFDISHSLSIEMLTSEGFNYKEHLRPCTL